MAADLTCPLCGVGHSERCPACGRWGFHLDGCPEMADSHTHTCDRCKTSFMCRCDSPAEDGWDCGACPVDADEEETTRFLSREAGDFASAVLPILLIVPFWVLA